MKRLKMAKIWFIFLRFPIPKMNAKMAKMSAKMAKMRPKMA